MAKRGRRRASNLVGPGYLVLAAALVALLLPSVLRPPPEQSQSSAAFSPDAPPDEEPDAIIQSLRQAASRTAGATGGGVPTPTTTAPTIAKPSRGQCFGDPPRQTESAYSPPCRAAFVGENGGTTHKNVSANEIRIGYWHLLGMPPERGPIADEVPPGESAPHRTARVIQQYFNERYELYGRHLRLVATPEDPPSPEEERASAINSVNAGVFAAVHLFYAYCDELANHDLPCFNGNPYPQRSYLSHEPLFWSYQANTDYTDRYLAEYVCKKLVNRNADFAGEGVVGLPRKLGVLVESTPQNDFRTAKSIENEIRDQCGATVAVAADMMPQGESQTALALAQMRQEGVTTIILESSASPVLQVMTAADGSRYFPEWVMFNSYGLDFNDSARLLPRAQRAHLFGMSGWELPRRFEDSDCYRAYKTIDPAGAPDANFCNLLYISIEHLVNGIQEAGPDLNPETFRDGMFSMPLAEMRHPWAIGGGYGPGDFSFVDDFSEIWWDDAAIDPAGGEQGAYRHTEGGARHRLGELDDVVRVFREGVAGYEPS